MSGSQRHNRGRNSYPPCDLYARAHGNRCTPGMLYLIARMVEGPGRDRRCPLTVWQHRRELLRYKTRPLCLTSSSSTAFISCFRKRLCSTLERSCPLPLCRHYCWITLCFSCFTLLICIVLTSTLASNPESNRLMQERNLTGIGEDDRGYLGL